jgi:hypothetical protein
MGVGVGGLGVGGKLRTYRKLKANFEAEKYLYTDVDKCSIATFVILILKEVDIANNQKNREYADYVL